MMTKIVEDKTRKQHRKLATFYSFQPKKEKHTVYKKKIQLYTEHHTRKEIINDNIRHKSEHSDSIQLKKHKFQLTRVNGQLEQYFLVHLKKHTFQLTKVSSQPEQYF